MQVMLNIKSLWYLDSIVCNKVMLQIYFCQLLKCLLKVDVSMCKNSVQTGLRSDSLSPRTPREKRRGGCLDLRTAQIGRMCFKTAERGTLASQDFLIPLKSIRKLPKHFIRNCNYFMEGVINCII